MPDRESIFICTVDNKPGVIEKVTDVFADLKININSVCAAPIHQMGKSSIVIVAEKSTVQPAKIEEILRSRMDYILVKDAERGDIYERELALVCVKCEIGHTAHIMQTAEMFNADVLGIGKESMTFEMVGLPDKVDAFIKALEEYGIIRLTRSGRAVMEKRGGELKVVKSLDEIISLAREMSPKKRIFVAAAAEHAAMESCAMAVREGIAEITLVGDKEKIESISKSDNINLSGLEIVNISDEKDALVYCLESYRDGKADLIMKGRISTGKMMQTALKKQYGLRTSRILSHVAIFEHEDRLVLMSDGGINIKPDIGRKAGIIENSVQAAHALGIKVPKVAILAAVEKIQLQAMPATRDAAILRKMYERGEITGCVVEGPLSLDLALSMHSAETKGVQGEVPGKADIIIAPDIACGNIIYKSISTIRKTPLAGVVTGSKTPIIIVSRADRTESKLYSVGASVYLAHKFAEAEN